MTMRNLLIAGAAALALGLAGCGSSSDNNTAMVEKPMVTEPMPTDLETAQTATTAAAAAAKTASDGAEAAAAGAMAALANLATMQTGAMAYDLKMEAKKYADMAMAEYMKAKAASEAAAAATTASAAGRALENAETAQMAAEDAAKMAGDKAMKATEAGMAELMIDGTMKSVGEGEDKSSVDAMSGRVTSADGKMVTGLLIGKEPDRATKPIPGVPFEARQTATGKDTAYVQAIVAGSINIGKTLDTSDDKARLTLITSYQGSKMVRVFTDSTNAIAGLDALIDSTTDTGLADTATKVTLKSIGKYYEAGAAATGGTADNLDATDEVDPGGEGVEVYLLSGIVDAAADTTPVSGYVRVVDTTRDPADTVKERTYQSVDIMADAEFDDFPEDAADRVKEAQVKAAIPAPVKYSHIHFGVWAGLGDAMMDGSQKVTDLSIGFVQNFSGSGVTDKQGIGKASFNGDWVAVVQPMYSSASMVEDGSATLMADFGTDKFTANLIDLAMLEGTLSGNGFSGMKATVDHDNLDSSGTFDGSFSGAIYGPDGDEAAGVFSFMGGEAGAFRGAFGGTSKP